MLRNMAFFCHDIKYHKYPLKLISGALLVLLAATLSVGVYTLNLAVLIHTKPLMRYYLEERLPMMLNM